MALEMQAVSLGHRLCRSGTGTAAWDVRGAGACDGSEAARARESEACGGARARGGIVWHGTVTLQVVARAREHGMGEGGEVDVGGCGGCGIDQTPAQLCGGPHMKDKERRKSWRPTRFLLTGRSGGNDRTLPPRVRWTPERSKTSRAATGRVR